MNNDDDNDITMLLNDVSMKSIQEALVQDTFMILFSYAIPFLFGIFFFKNWLFRDYEVKSKAMVILFALTFALAINMQFLILFEIVHAMHANSRWVLWKIDLHVLIVLLTVVIPFGICIATVRQNQRISWIFQIIFAGILYSIFLYVYMSLGYFFPHIASGVESNLKFGAFDPKTFSTTILNIEMGVGRIGLLGVAAMATLSGFGAVDSPYRRLTFFLRSYNDHEIELMETRLIQSLREIASKKKRIALLKSRGNNVNTSHSHMDATSRGGGLVSGVKWFGTMLLYSITGIDLSGSSKDEKALVAEIQREIVTLEAFHQELFLDIAEMHEARRLALFSKTLYGSFYFLLGYLFSVYCVYKCIMASINIIFSRVARKDPISLGFEIALMFFNIHIDIHFWSQILSLIMVGILMFTSVRGFLITIAKIFHQFSTSWSSHKVALLLDQMMGMYFISFTLLMRMNLPPEYRAVVTQVLGGDLDFSFYHSFFDRIFLSSAILTCIVLYIFDRQKQERTKTHIFEDKYA